MQQNPPAPYTAITSYKKLVGAYPFIRIASDTPTATVHATRELCYAERDGHSLRLDMFTPAKKRRAQPFAAVVLVHGGGWRSGERNNLAPMAVRLAERGIAAATITYRLADEARYPAAIHDVKAALRWVRANAATYGIDPLRIAVAGASAGGQIASLVGVTNGRADFDPDAAVAHAAIVGAAVASDARAIINIDGLSDFTSEAARVNEDDPSKKPSAAGFWLGGRYTEKPELWREASPTFYVGSATPPILFIGSGQSRFSVGRDEMIVKLDAAGVVNRVKLLPSTPHSFWLFDPWLDPTVDAMVEFIGEVLPQAAPKKWIPLATQRSMTRRILAQRVLMQRKSSRSESSRNGTSRNGTSRNGTSRNGTSRNEPSRVESSNDTSSKIKSTYATV